PGRDGGDNGGKLRWGWARTGRRLTIWTWDLLGASLHVTTPLGELANDEFLGQAGADSFRSSDCEVSKHETSAAVRFGKVKVRKAGRRQITTNTGVVRYPLSAVTPRDKRTEHRVPDPRTCRTGSLIKVAGILMKQGRQDGAANHDVRETVCCSRTEALSK